MIETHLDEKMRFVMLFEYGKKKNYFPITIINLKTFRAQKGAFKIT